MRSTAEKQWLLSNAQRVAAAVGESTELTALVTWAKDSPARCAQFMDRHAEHVALAGKVAVVRQGADDLARSVPCRGWQS
jgi:hypothetical protein